MSILLNILKYLPYVTAGVVGVEQAVGAGNGTAKKQIVLNSVQVASQVGEQVPEAHIAAISALIDATVATLNATNLLGFGHKAPAQ